MCHKHWNVRKRLRNISFNENLSMKLYTYKENTIMNNLPHQKFQFAIKSKSLYWVVHYVTIMLMIMIFFDCKLFFHKKYGWVC
jgi:hypothetical protein